MAARKVRFTTNGSKVGLALPFATTLRRKEGTAGGIGIGPNNRSFVVNVADIFGNYELLDSAAAMITSGLLLAELVEGDYTTVLTAEGLEAVVENRPAGPLSIASVPEVTAGSYLFGGASNGAIVEPSLARFQNIAINSGVAPSGGTNVIRVTDLDSGTYADVTLAASATFGAAACNFPLFNGATFNFKCQSVSGSGTDSERLCVVLS